MRDLCSSFACRRLVAAALAAVQAQAAGPKMPWEEPGGFAWLVELGLTAAASAKIEDRRGAQCERGDDQGLVMTRQRGRRSESDKLSRRNLHAERRDRCEEAEFRKLSQR